ncbi:MAG: hypothetical protein ACK478_00445 [Flavobacteriales bacterium]
MKMLIAVVLWQFLLHAVVSVLFVACSLQTSAFRVRPTSIQPMLIPS